MFLSHIYKIFLFSFVAILLNSCNEFQRVLKVGDLSEKLTLGEKLYKEGNYKKAIRVFGLIAPAYRGKPQSERVSYYEADTYYKLEDYYVAGYKMERFVAAFPKSDKAEECSFKAAKSLYEISPRYSLDQKETLESIEKFQTFINEYPESDYIEEANKCVEEMQTKLELKYYSIAKRNHHRLLYKAAIKSFSNYLITYPGSAYAEKALYYRLESAYKLAIDSYENLIPERLKIAQEYYEDYEKQSNDENLKKKAQKISENITKRLQTIN